MYTRKPLPKIKSKGLIIKLFLVMACYTIDNRDVRVRVRVRSLLSMVILHLLKKT